MSQCTLFTLIFGFMVSLRIIQGPVSIYDKTSYRKISWSLEAVRFVFKIVWSLWNLTGTSAALLPVKFQSDVIFLTATLMASRLHEILRWDVLSDIEMGPRWRGDSNLPHRAKKVLSKYHVHIWQVSPQFSYTMMTSSNGNIFRVTGHFCREFTGYRWIPCTKASNMELWCFRWSEPE